MDQKSLREKDFEVDLENGVVVSEEDSSDSAVSSTKKQAKTLIAKVCGGLLDGTVKVEDRIGLCGNGSNSSVVCPDNLKVATNKVLEGNECIDHVEKSRVKDKRKKTSNKKPPKPPRPPRGPSLDAADQKLIKELSEIAMWKRARIERIKALKKMKAAKASSSNSSTFAMLLTILFCLVLILQGISYRRSSPVNFEGSPVSAGGAEGNLISVQYYPNPSSNGPGSASPKYVKFILSSYRRAGCWFGSAGEAERMGRVILQCGCLVYVEQQIPHAFESSCKSSMLALFCMHDYRS